MKIVVDIGQIRNFEKDLLALASKALPQVTKWVLNTAAFDSRENAQNIIRENMILRNSYTLRSIRVEQTRSLNINDQESIVGSTAEYMERQEIGGTKHSKGGSNLHIPTSFSAGQSMTSKPRMKMPRGQNKLSKIRLRKTGKKFSSKKQRNFVAIKMAAEAKLKYVYLNLPKSKGIFKIMGGKRKRQIKMVHDMSRKSVKTMANPWLAPAVEKVKKKIPRLYATGLKFNMKKYNLFN